MRNEIKKNKKTIYIASCIMLLFLLSMVLAYKNKWVQSISQPWAVMTVEDKDISSNNTDDMFQLKENETVCQEIKMVSDRFSGISIYLDNRNTDTEGMLKVILTDTTQECVIKEWEYDLSDCHIDGFYNFYLDEPYEVQRNNIYEIRILIENLSDNASLLLKKANGSSEIHSAMKCEGLEYDFSFSYKILEGDCGSLKVLFVLFVIIGILIIASFLVLLIKNKKIEWIFVFTAFLIGIIYLFMLPPFATPDEGSHYVTVYAESNILLNQEAYDSTGKVVADGKSALYLIREEKPTKDTYVRYIKGVFGKTESVKDDLTVLRKPLSMKHPGYIPQVLGVSLARILNMNGEQILLLGRLFALVWYCFVMYWSIKIIPYWKMNLFIIGILPMTMQQVVSYNYDSVLFGLVFLLFTYILYLKYTKDGIEWKDYLILTVCSVCIVTIKFIYLPILAMAILIPKEKFGGIKKKISAAVVLNLISGVAFVLTRLNIFEKAISTEGIHNDGLKYYTLQMCLAQPIDTVVIFYRTIQEKISQYLISMLTSPLGWVEIEVPEIVFLVCVILLLLSIWSENKNIQIHFQEKCIYGLIAGGIFLLVLLAMLLDYTYIGSEIILGVQGRYFLPILPIMMIMLQTKKIELHGNINNYLMLGMISAQMYTILSVTSTIVSR